MCTRYVNQILPVLRCTAILGTRWIEKLMYTFDWREVVHEYL